VVAELRPRIIFEKKNLFFSFFKQKKMNYNILDVHDTYVLHRRIQKMKKKFASYCILLSSTCCFYVRCRFGLHFLFCGKPHMVHTLNVKYGCITHTLFYFFPFLLFFFCGVFVVAVALRLLLCKLCQLAHSSFLLFLYQTNAYPLCCLPFNVL
jgi:hypothetical protein